MSALDLSTVQSDTTTHADGPDRAPRLRPDPRRLDPPEPAMTVPDHLQDVPLPSDAVIAECVRCAAHYQADKRQLTTAFQATAEFENRHPSDVLLAYYRVLHMEQRHDH